MAKSSDRSAARKRSSPLTDYHDASEPLEPKGFGEAPQADLEGAPYQGNVADWVRDLEEAAAKEARKASTRAIRSEAGKHRLKASVQFLGLLCEPMPRVFLSETKDLEQPL